MNLDCLVRGGGVDKILLNYQANRIEKILQSNGIVAQVGNVDIGGYIASYRVHVGLNQTNVLHSIQKLAPDIARELGVEGEILVRRDTSIIRIEMAGEQFMPVTLRRVTKKAGRMTDSHTMILGADLSGRVQILRMSTQSDKTAHVLVSGLSGSGKTALVRAMVTSLVDNTSPDEAALILIDPKGGNFSLFAKLPHLAMDIVEGVENKAEKAYAALTALTIEMNKRGREGWSRRLYLVVDEMADLISVGGSAIESELSRLLQMGRSLGIHVIGGTQKPTASSIGSLIASGFTLRIVGKVGKSSDAVIAAGRGGSGAENLLGKGDFLIVHGTKLIRFQAAYADESYVTTIVAQCSATTPVPSLTSGRRWVFEEDKPRGIRNILPFVSRGKSRRGGHNKQEFLEAQIEDAKNGESVWRLRKKYGLSGSRAARLVEEYGPKKSIVS